MQVIQETFKNTQPAAVSNSDYEDLQFTQDETNPLIYRFNIDIKALKFTNYEEHRNNFIKYILIENNLDNYNEVKAKLKEIIEKQIETILNIDSVDEILKNIEYNLTDDLNILITVNLLSEEERHNHNKIIKFSCWCCLQEKEELNIKYCKNRHNENVCLICYNDLKQRAIKCGICRGKLYIKDDNLNINNLLESILRIKGNIFYNAKAFNLCILDIIKEKYFIDEDNIFIYPFDLSQLNYNYPYLDGLDGVYEDIKDKINNITIDNRDDYDNRDFIILRIILESVFFMLEPSDIEDEAEQQKQLTLTAAAFYKIYEGELKGTFKDAKIILISPDFNYKKHIIDVYNLYKYFVFCVDKVDDAIIKKYYIEIEKDILNNDLDKSSNKQYIFKYNNKKIIMKDLKSDDDINIYVCKKIIKEEKKKTKNPKYIYDGENIERHYINIKTHTELKEEFEEYFKESYPTFSFYNYLNDGYIYSYDFHNFLMNQLEEADFPILEEYYNKNIDGNINLDGLYHSYRNDRDDTAELIKLFGNITYYLNQVDNISHFIDIELFNEINF